MTESSLPYKHRCVRVLYTHSHTQPTHESIHTHTHTHTHTLCPSHTHTQTHKHTHTHTHTLSSTHRSTQNKLTHLLQALLAMDAAKQQLLLEQQLAARRAMKIVKIEQNNDKERELVCESQARKGQAGGCASSVDEQASTSSFRPHALVA